MPKVKPNEKKEDFIKRCIPYVKEEEPDLPNDAVVAKCHGIWKSKDTNKQLFTFDMYEDGALEWEDMCDLNLFKDDKDGSFPAVCLIGDKFYKGSFVSADEIEKAYRTMDGAYHDLNHWSTSYPGGFSPEPNIEYVVGYQDGTTFDRKTKRMKTNIHIVDSAPKAQAWHGFMEIARRAKRVPNVSVTFWAERKDMSTDDLPDDVDYKQYGLSKGDRFIALVNLEFHALATVFRGACDDKSGCGIGIEYDDTDTVTLAYYYPPEAFYQVDRMSPDEIKKLKKLILKEKIKMEELQ